MPSNRTPAYEEGEGSQESYSGQGTTPEATPTLAARKAWTNGNDSGFDSMQRDGRQGEIVSGDNAHQHFHSGVCVSLLHVHSYITYTHNSLTYEHIASTINVCVQRERKRMKECSV
jgi:hypothetical protein